MKLLLSWIFDHIAYPLDQVDVDQLLTEFGSSVAEIDSIATYSFEAGEFTLGRVTALKEAETELMSTEYNKKIIVAPRAEAQLGGLYLLKKDGKSYRWATLSDFGSTKEDLFCVVSCPEDQIAGDWKKYLLKTDYIIEVDNKALTHRPDMWCHRGFAREMAALLKKQLRSEDDFLVSKSIKHYEQSVPQAAMPPFSIELSQDHACAHVCNRFAALYISQIPFKHSFIDMAIRLARVDARPLNAIVDSTNYVMFDISQPMHAYDAQQLPGHDIGGRCAHEGEKLVLLDGETITLTTQDYVVTAGSQPVGLAGIMGGLATSVSPRTTSLVIEAAHWNPTVIRKTAQRFKKRTESSTRYEKNLDPNQNTTALLRFLKLMQDHDIPYKSADSIVSLGQLAQERVITISHELIVRKLGITVSPDQVESILKDHGFGVQSQYVKDHVEYRVVVPTYRGTKDVTIAEDIVEEVGRMLGYNMITPQAPVRAMVPFDISVIMNVRRIKQHLAYGIGMHEIQSYAFYDEEFLKRIAYNPEDALRIANPLSEHWQRLVTSLVPNLLKTVELNHTKAPKLSFFEYDSVWFFDHEAVESKEIAGIFFEHKKEINFYDAKAQLDSLFTLLKLPVEWSKPTNTLEPWYHQYQTADLYYNDLVVGRAGKVDPFFLHQIVEGDAFVFELNADFLLLSHPPLPVYEPVAKYPEVTVDISLLIAQDVSVDTLEKALQKTDPLVKTVVLVDFFSKAEWINQRSLTFRVVLADPDKTMTKQDIDRLTEQLHKVCTRLGAQIR